MSANAVAKLTQLNSSRLLFAKIHVVYPTCIFVLGEAGAKALGLRLDRPALGPQSLPTEHAVLLYCSHGHPQRHRLTVAELRERWPWLPAVLAMAPHSLVLELTETLELLRIDLGRAGGPHVARSVRPTSTPVVSFGVHSAPRHRAVSSGFHYRHASEVDRDQAGPRPSKQPPPGLRMHASVIPFTSSCENPMRDVYYQSVGNPVQFDRLPTSRPDTEMLALLSLSLYQLEAAGGAVAYRGDFGCVLHTPHLPRSWMDVAGTIDLIVGAVSVVVGIAFAIVFCYFSFPAITSGRSGWAGAALSQPAYAVEGHVVIAALTMGGLTFAYGWHWVKVSTASPLSRSTPQRFALNVATI